MLAAFWTWPGMRWELPNLYSHFGSRGIAVMTVLQSGVQGEEVWGEKGLRKLWTAANLPLYAGGVSDERWLRELSALIGSRDVSRWSHSTGRGGATRSQSWSREPILDVDELAALPRGRGALLSSGNKATMLRTVPWMDGPHAAAVRASLSRREPVERTAEREEASAQWRPTPSRPPPVPAAQATHPPRCARAAPTRCSGREPVTAEPKETPEPREPRYATLEAFVVEFIGPIIARRQPGDTCGAPSGGTTPKPWPALWRYGKRGSSPASTVARR